MHTSDNDRATQITADESENDAPVRKIIHVDMDAFYASVEQRDNPELRGKPVAVGSAAARGVVAAASYEARVFGVRSALPSVTAKRRCPDLIFVPPRFDVYRAVSARIHQIFAEHTDLIEPLSLDEAYLDVSENKQNIKVATEIATMIRARIKEVTGLNASAGISYCKFLAKMASDLNKPNGQAVITPTAGPDFVANLPVKKFHGVGPATAAKMERLGIETGADLRGKPLEFLQKHFGKSGSWYYRISRGIDERPVQPNRERKSIGAEDTFSVDIFDLETALVELTPLVEKVWRHCEGKQLYGRTVTLKVKYADFQQITRSRTVGMPLRAASDVESIAQSLLAPLFPTGKGIRLIGVTISSLHDDEHAGHDQLSLIMFDWTKSCSYDDAQKRRFHATARSRLKQLAAALHLPPGTFEIRSNRGGIAVSGEVTLHHDRAYVQVGQFGLSSGHGILIRTCEGRRDYTGGANHFAALSLLDDIPALAATVHAITGVGRTASGTVAHAA